MFSWIENLIQNKQWGLRITFVLILAVYVNILQNRLVMDDFSFIVNWPLIKDWRNFTDFFTSYAPPAGYEGIYSPLKTLFYFFMAETYIQLDDKQKSAEALEQAIVLNPQYAAAHYNLAGLYMFLGRKGEGLEHFRKSIALYREQGSNQEADKWEKAFKDFFLPDS